MFARTIAWVSDFSKLRCLERRTNRRKRKKKCVCVLRFSPFQRRAWFSSYEDWQKGSTYLAKMTLVWLFLFTEIPLPNEQARMDILKIHSAKITKHGDIGGWTTAGKTKTASRNSGVEKRATIDVQMHQTRSVLPKTVAYWLTTKISEILHFQVKLKTFTGKLS